MIWEFACPITACRSYVRAVNVGADHRGPGIFRRTAVCLAGVGRRIEEHVPQFVSGPMSPYLDACPWSALVRVVGVKIMRAHLYPRNALGSPVPVQVPIEFGIADTAPIQPCQGFVLTRLYIPI
jgi:hypothetical protein